VNHGAKLDQQEVLRALFHNLPSEWRFEIAQQFFVEQKIPITMTKILPNGQFPLQAICATHNGSQGFELVKCFIENGAEVNSRLSTPEGYTALHFAVQHGQLRTICYLLKEGARVRRWFREPRQSLFELCVAKCPTECGWNCGHDRHEEVASRVAIWHLLLAVRAEINDEAETARFPLGNSLAQALVTWTPQSQLIDVAMRTPAMMSEGVETFESWNGKKQSRGPFSALQIAIKKDYIEIAKDLLKNKAEINEAAGSKNGGTALQLAIQRHPTMFDLEFITYLLDHGADINASAAREHGRTALQRACAMVPLNFPLVRLLLEHEADVNGPAAEVSGRTALQFACVREEIDFELVNLLIEHGLTLTPQLPQRME
jgi:hypothetical protein